VGDLLLLLVLLPTDATTEPGLTTSPTLTCAHTHDHKQVFRLCPRCVVAPFTPEGLARPLKQPQTAAQQLCCLYLECLQYSSMW
jgi:hypothetical protein